MKKFFLLFLISTLAKLICAQSKDTISQEEVTRIISFLASDDLRGRGNETRELQRAAYFIEQEFKKDSLQFFGQFSSYLQPFSLDEVSDQEKTKDSNGRFRSVKVMFNVIGVLPGKSIPDEMIIFSAHYDHLGARGSGNDDIYNGANDDASGTTAMITLAHYFAQRNDNARTLVFCAFAAEELGLIGSNVFAHAIDPEKVVAMINIEMIGRTNVAGRNGFFITGANYSNLAKIVKANLKDKRFKVVREPSDLKQLFSRSDNFSFATLGIPAHTIMCSDDDDPCYHKPCDEVTRLDLANMTSVIKAIAYSVRTIVSGKETPRRISTKKFY
jgi:hypothetical protein